MALLFISEEARQYLQSLKSDTPGGPLWNPMVWAWCYQLPIVLAVLAFVGSLDFMSVIEWGVHLLLVCIATRDLSFQVACRTHPKVALDMVSGLAIDLLEKLDVDDLHLA